MISKVVRFKIEAMNNIEGEDLSRARNNYYKWFPNLSEWRTYAKRRTERQLDKRKEGKSFTNG